MPDDTTAVTHIETLDVHLDEDDDRPGPCVGCGLANPVARRSCLACGAPLGSADDPTSTLPADPPLLERERECETIDVAARRLMNDRLGGVLAISGPPGAGRTRMLRHAVERLLVGDRVRLLSTTVRESDGPHAPITRLLWERFGVTPSKGPQAARGEIIAEVNRLLNPRSLAPTEHAQRIIVATGLPGDGTRSLEHESDHLLGRLAERVGRFLAADAEEKPIALLVDDFDAASEEGARLFALVMGAVSKSPVLAVVAGDAAVREHVHDLREEQLDLQPLSRAACDALCRALLPGLETLPDELVAAVVARSECWPGRVREILLALIESRVIVADETPWRVDLDALQPGGPISTGDILRVRLGRLDAEALATLGRAAVVGEVFWNGAVAAMVRVEEGASDPHADDPIVGRTHEALRRLVGAELIEPIEESEFALERQFSFAVAGLRAQVLRELDADVAKQRHEVCAAWLDLAAGPRAEDLARAIASHLEKADMHDASARAFLRAARVAQASYRGPLAVEMFDKALTYLPAGNAPVRIDALHDKGVVLSLLGRVDEARLAFESMLDLAHRYGARNKIAAALGRLGRLARARGDLHVARTLLWRALDLFQQAEDQRGVAAVQDDLGVVANLAGDLDGAVQHSTEALRIRQSINDPLGEALSTHNLGLVHLQRGQPRQARAHFERALALRESCSDIAGATLTRNALAVLAYERGDIEQAEKSWTEVLELARALGDKRVIVMVSANLGEAAIQRGDTTTATQQLEVAEQLAIEMDDSRALAEIERTRGLLARVSGDGERSKSHLDRSLSIARSLGIREAEALALRGLGETAALTVFDETGESARTAQVYFEQAVQILEELGATRELARTRALYGAHLIERGDTLNGRRVLSLAVPVLERLDLAEAGNARAALQRAGGAVIVPGA